MRITPITPRYNSYIKSSAVQKPYRDEVSFGALNCKTLEGITYEKYKNLSLFDKLKYRLFTPLGIKHDARMNYYAASKARGYLDNVFGKDNYTLIVIGRSMASIGETIGLFGRDVKLLPMSGISDGLPENIKHVDVYRKYLQSIGLTKDFIEQNPERKFILLDFVSGGGTIEHAHEFLSRPDLLGNPSRLISMSAQSVLNGSGIIKSYMELLFMCSKLKMYSPIGRLTLDKLDKTFEQIHVNPLFKDKRNLFLFNVMRRVERYNKKTGN